MKVYPPITAQAKIQILKSINEVHDAICNPEKMSNYFIAKGSGKLEPGKEIYWSFPEFEGEFPLKVLEVSSNLIVINWDLNNPNAKTEFRLTQVSDSKTIVEVSEHGKFADRSGIEWAIKNTEGWANFLACLKAYLEYDINLRKGAFDFMKSN